MRPPVPNRLKMLNMRESSSEVKYSVQRMLTIERMSQPAAIASSEALPEKMPELTPWTENTIATAPKTEIWRRCMAMESVARV